MLCNFKLEYHTDLLRIRGLNTDPESNMQIILDPAVSGCTTLLPAHVLYRHLHSSYVIPCILKYGQHRTAREPSLNWAGLGI
jgi:hypothetical protein